MVHNGRIFSPKSSHSLLKPGGGGRFSGRITPFSAVFVRQAHYDIAGGNGSENSGKPVS